MWIIRTFTSLFLLIGCVVWVLVHRVLVNEPALWICFLTSCGDLYLFHVISKNLNLCYDYSKWKLCYFQVVKKDNELEDLKSQLAELQQKFHSLSSVDEKLQTLEKKLQGKIVIEENEWSNLLSRVLLLETQLLLHSKTVCFIMYFPLC